MKIVRLEDNVRFAGLVAASHDLRAPSAALQVKPELGDDVRTTIAERDSAGRLAG